MRCKLLTFSAVLSLMLIPLISAYTWAYGSPLDYVNTEWVKFGLVFALLLIAIYSIVRHRTDNSVVSAITGVGLSLLLTIPIMKSELFESFLGESTLTWMIIIAIIIALIILLYWLFTKFKFKGLLLSLFLIALAIVIFPIKDILPDSIMYGPVGEFIEFVQGFSNIIIIGVIGIAIIWIIWWIKKKISRGNIGRRRQSNQRNQQRQTTQQQTQKQPPRVTNARKTQAYIHSYKEINKRINTREGYLTKVKKGSITHNPKAIKKVQQELIGLNKIKNNMINKAKRICNIDLSRYG